MATSAVVLRRTGRALIKPDDPRQPKRVIPGGLRLTKTQALPIAGPRLTHAPRKIRARQSLSLPTNRLGVVRGSFVSVVPYNSPTARRVRLRSSARAVLQKVFEERIQPRVRAFVRIVVRSVGHRDAVRETEELVQPD